MRLSRGVTVVSAASALLLLVSAGPAAASGSVDRTSSAITYQHTGGTSDHVTVSTDAGKVVIEVDEGVTAAAACDAIDAFTVACDPSPVVVVFGGGFDDTLLAKELGGLTAQLYGLDGADHVTGNSTSNLIDGGSGNDVVDGSGGVDQVTGGAGSDTIGGGSGDDVIASRDGEVDTVDCGVGADVVTADVADVLTGCETVQLPAKVTPTFSFKVKDKTAAGVLVKKLVVSGLAPGDAVSVSCQGRTCPFKSKAGKVAGGKSKLTKLFKKHRVKKLTVTITVTRAGAIGVVETLQLKKGKVKTSTQCLAPGSTSPTSC